ncbi:MAG: hypothetical protein HY808_08450 [Nitrospirae bacterium]|nr:hypothetical protein [Nitrospirota bacterium]
MKLKKLFITGVFAVSMLMISAMASATQSASILYQETNLGGSLWQYDYIFQNNSDAGEYLYKVNMDFGQLLDVTGDTLPSGWTATMWEGTNNTSYVDAFTTDTSFDIAPGNSQSGFRFTVNQQVGNLAYTAEFDDHAGNLSASLGNTAPVAPEPVSTILFLTGGATLAARRYLKRR